MRRRHLVWIPFAAVLAMAPACRDVSGEATSPGRNLTLRLLTGPPGGGFLPLGQRMAVEFQRLAPGPRIDTRSSEGAIANVLAIQHGDTDLGFTFADVAYMSYSGQLEGTPALDQLRGIALLQLTPITFVARADVPMKSPADLRGRVVAVGPPGSGTALTAALILHAFGLDAPAVRVETLGFQEAGSRLINGSVDAMFDNAINQSDSIARAIAAGARLVPIEGPAVDALRRDYPFFKITSIPASLYPNEGKPTHTIGVDGLLIGRKNLDDAIVYQFTEHLFRVLPQVLGDESRRFINLEQASATPIPLHNGAARYYRERELLR
jgi:TRAP transporter TAXI family solute receptor